MLGIVYVIFGVGAYRITNEVTDFRTGLQGATLLLSGTANLAWLLSFAPRLLIMLSIVVNSGLFVLAARLYARWSPWERPDWVLASFAAALVFFSLGHLWSSTVTNKIISKGIHQAGVIAGEK